MKTVIVNGSPRKGNTLTAINAYVEGAGKAQEIEVINADRLNISGCKGAAFASVLMVVLRRMIPTPRSIKLSQRIWSSLARLYTDGV